MTLRNKLRKAVRALRQPLTRRALRRGIAATYEHETLLRGLGALQTVIDVGANVGQFTLLCRLTQPSATVHAFEPMSHAAGQFQAVFEFDPMVHLHRTALGSTPGTAEIHVAARADSSSLMPQAAQSTYFPATAEVGTETIQIARLSDIMTAEQITGPSLLKIDVQGYEGEVLKGCADLLDRFDWIYCEASFVELYKGQPLAHEIVVWLAARGFGIAGVEIGPGMVFEGRAVQADFLFSRIKKDAA